MSTQHRAAAIAYLAFALAVAAQTWTQTTAPTASWRAIACSADGTKIVAAAWDGGIYRTLDAGATWSPSDAPQSDWVAVASSVDASRMIAVSRFVYLSTNSGANWQLTDAPEGSWLAATASADGSKLWVVGLHGMVMSTDGGLTWPEDLNLAAGGFLKTVAASADGISLVVGVGYDNFPVPLLRSTNSGSSWDSITSHSAVWYSLASSADGTRVAGSGSGTYGLATSTDAGASWTRHDFPGRATLTCAADGSKLMASAEGTNYFSTNWGRTWVTNSIFHGNILAASADANTLIGVDQNNIWISQATPKPLLSIAASPKQCVLSWLIPSAPFALQESSDLDSIPWTPVAGTLTINFSNLHYQAVVPNQGHGRFYRLNANSFQ